MAIAKGYWRTAQGYIDRWTMREKINIAPIDLREQYTHNSRFAYTYSARSKKNDLYINGFTKEHVPHLPFCIPY